MELAHTVPLDRLAAEEIGALLAPIQALDAELDRRGPVAGVRPRCSIFGCARAAGWSGGCGSSGLRPQPARSGRHGSPVAGWPLRLRGGANAQLRRPVVAKAEAGGAP